jgi:hypothetical protein
MSESVDATFDVTVDHYRGVTVKTSSLKCRSVDEFATKLKNSLKKWTDEVKTLHIMTSRPSH